MTHTRFLTALGMLLCLTPQAWTQSIPQQPAPLIAKLECPDRVKDVAFSPDGRFLAAGYGWNDQGGARIWSLPDRSTVATLSVGEGDSANVELVAFSPDGRLFAAADWDGDVLLWTVGTWGSHRVVLSHRGSPKALSFSPSGARLAFATEEAALLYDFRTHKTTMLGTRGADRNSFIGVSFSPDEKTVTVFRDRAVEVRDTETGKLVRSWKPQGAGFFGRVSPDGRYVIAGGGAVYGRKSVEVWDANDGRRVGEMSEFRGGLFALAVSHKGRLFAVAGGNYGSGGDLSLWDLEGSRELGFVSFGEMPIEGLAFSPDDRTLAAGSNDGYVLLYAAERIRGPEVKKQTSPLCGEVVSEGDRTLITPLSKVPTPMGREFEFPWRLEVANPESVRAAAGEPVVLQDWAIESSAATDRAKVIGFRSLLPRGRSSADSDHIIFGHTQNPGWDESFVVKIYGDGTFLATNNSGKCLSSGRLDQFKTDFESLRKRLVGEGLLEVPKEPLTLGADHYGTAYIELSAGGVTELRSDADDISVLLKGGPAKKREAFARVFRLEEVFVNSLVHAGMKPPEQ